MKKIKSPFTLSICITFFLTTTAYSQTEKRNLLLGGSMGLSNGKSEIVGFQEQEVFNFNFSPNISYAIIDKLIVGVVIPFSYRKSSTSTQDLKTTQFSVGPRIRYYFPFGDVAVFPEVTYTFGKIKADNPVFDLNSGQVENAIIKGDLSDFKAGVGITYFLNSNIGLEGILSYNKRSIDYNSSFATDNKSSSISFDIGFQIYFQTQKLN